MWHLLTLNVIQFSISGTMNYEKSSKQTPTGVLEDERKKYISSIKHWFMLLALQRHHHVSIVVIQTLRKQ